MKTAIFFFVFLIAKPMMAQPENDAIKKTISTFFDGMVKKDSSIIRSSLDSSCFLYSIMQKKDGSIILEEEKTDELFKQVAELKNEKFDERLSGYDIKIDGAMAIAWTPYKFYLNDNFSHCGVNVFTLIKRGNAWKIMGITDTRRRTGCE